MENDNLSGGEQRKNAIVRAYAKSADLLLMDEPDNNLDDDAVSELTGILNNGKHELITIIISHDERLALTADEVINMTL